MGVILPGYLDLVTQSSADKDVEDKDFVRGRQHTSQLIFQSDLSAESLNKRKAMVVLCMAVTCNYFTVLN